MDNETWSLSRWFGVQDHITGLDIRRAMLYDHNIPILDEWVHAVTDHPEAVLFPNSLPGFSRYLQ